MPEVSEFILLGPKDNGSMSGAPNVILNNAQVTFAQKLYQYKARFLLWMLAMFAAEYIFSKSKMKNLRWNFVWIVFFMFLVNRNPWIPLVSHIRLSPCSETDEATHSLSASFALAFAQSSKDWANLKKLLAEVGETALQNGYGSFDSGKWTSKKPTKNKTIIGRRSKKGKGPALRIPWIRI